MAGNDLQENIPQEANLIKSRVNAGAQQNPQGPVAPNGGNGGTGTPAARNALMQGTQGAQTPQQTHTQYDWRDFDPTTSAATERLRGAASLLKQKQDIISKSLERKKDRLEPLRLDNISLVDGDSGSMVNELGEQELIRFSTTEGTVDTYESDVSTYERRPDILKRHQRSLGQYLGVDADEITPQQLVDQGKLAAARTQELLAKANANGTLSFERSGVVDENGRTVINISDSGQDPEANVVNQLTGLRNNANYFSEFNAVRRAKDAFSGVAGEQMTQYAKKDRGWFDAVTDTGVNIIGGGIEMGQDMLHGTAILTKLSAIDGVDKAFINGKERIQRLRGNVTSDAQKARTMFRGRELQDQEAIFDINMAAYKEAGAGGKKAWIKAVGTEFNNTLRSIKQNPGRLLDSIAESATYMAGIGAVGKIGTNVVINGLVKKQAKELIAAGVSTSASGATARAAVNKYLATPEGIKRISTAAERVGYSSVGISEGLMNGAETYQSIINATPEQLTGNEDYDKAVAEGLSHEMAARRTGELAARKVAGLTAIFAGTIGKITGASGVNAKLFTRTGDNTEQQIAKTLLRKTKSELRATKRKVKTEAREALGKKKGITRTGAELFGRGVAKAARSKTAADITREAIEESAQSGGGELIAQVIKSDILGTRVGPGVGTAAAEGLTAGIGSAAMMSGGSNIIKGGVNIALNPLKYFNKENIENKKTLTNADGSSVGSNDRLAGGSSRLANQEIANVIKSKDTTHLGKLLTSALDSTGLLSKDPKKRKDVDLSQANLIVKIARHLYGADVSGAPDSVRPAIEAVSNGYVSQLHKNATDIVNNTDSKYTPEEIHTVLNAVVEGAGLTKKGQEALDKNNPELYTAYKRVEDLNSMGVAAMDTLNELQGILSEAYDPKTADRIYNKAAAALGIASSTSGAPGLLQTIQQVIEAVATNNTGDLYNDIGVLMQQSDNLNSEVVKLQKEIEKDKAAGDTESAVAKGNLLEAMNSNKALIQNVIDKSVQIFETVNPRTNIAEITDAIAKAVAQQELVNADGSKNYQGRQGTLNLPPVSDKESSNPPTEQELELAKIEVKAHREEQQGSQKEKELDGEIKKLEKDIADLRKKEQDIHKQAPEAADLFSGTKDYEESYMAQLEAGYTAKETELTAKQEEFNNINSGNENRKAANLKKVAAARDAKEARLNAKKAYDEANAAFEKEHAKIFSNEYVEGVLNRKIIPDEPLTEAEQDKLARAREKSLKPLLDKADSEYMTQLKKDIEKSIRELKNNTKSADESGSKTTTKKKSDGAKGTTGNKTKKGKKAVKSDSSKESTSEPVVTTSTTRELDKKDYIGTPVEVTINGATYTVMTDAKGIPTGMAVDAEGFMGHLSLSSKDGSWDFIRSHRNVTAASSIEDSSEKIEINVIGNIQTPTDTDDISASSAEMAKEHKNLVAGITKLIKTNGTEVFEVAFIEEGSTDKVTINTNPAYGPQTYTIETGVVSKNPNIHKKPLEERKVTPATPFADLSPRQQVVELDHRIRLLKNLIAELKKDPTQTIQSINEANDGKITGNVDLDLILINSAELARSEEAIANLIDAQNVDRADLVDGAKAGGLDLDRLARLPTSISEEDLAKIKDVREKNTKELKGDSAKGLLRRVIDFGSAVAKQKTTLMERIGRKGHESQTFAEYMTQLGLPMSLREVFDVKKGLPDLLVQVPNIMDYLEVESTRNEIIKLLSLSTEDTKAMNAFIYHYAKLRISLDSAYISIKNTNPGFLDEKLTQEAIHYLEVNVGTDTAPTYRLSAEVIGAIALETFNFTGSILGTTLTRNDSKSINKILGRKATEKVSTAESTKLGTVGMLRSEAINSMGPAIFKHLGLTLSKNGKDNFDSLFEQRLQAALGALAVTSLIGVGYAEQVPVSRKWMNAHMDKDKLAEQQGKSKGRKKVSTDSNINFLRIQGGPSEKKPSFLADIQAVIRVKSALFTSLFNMDTYTKTPMSEQELAEHTAQIKNMSQDKIRRSISNTPAEMRKRMNVLTNRAYETNKAGIQLIRRFGSIENYLIAMHGYVTEEQIESSVRVDKEADVRAHNEQLVRAVEDALAMAESPNSDKFYFRQFMHRAGRVSIDSTSVDPQGDKMHRAMFGMKAWKRVISVDPNNKEGGYHGFMVSIAQGLGFKVDKDGELLSVAALEAVLDDETVKAAIDLLVESKGFDAATKFSEAQRKVLTDARELLDVEEGSLFLVSMDALADLQIAKRDGKETMTTSVAFEIDGTNNGLMAGILQYPLLSDMSNGIDPGLKKMAERMGMIFNDDAYKNGTGHASSQEYRARGNEDNYEAGARLTATKMKAQTNRSPDVTAEDKKNKVTEQDIALLNATTDVASKGFLASTAELLDPNTNKVTSVGRKLLKNPLMIIVYGASLFNIVKDVVEQSLQNFYDELAKTTTEREAMAVINRAIEVINITETASGRRTLTPKYTKDTFAKVLKDFNGDIKKLRREYTLTNSAESSFLKAFTGTYGVALEGALQDMLGPYLKYREQLNASNAFSNIIFARDFERRVKALEELKGKYLSRSDLETLLDAMYDDGLVPGIATALSKDDGTENLELTNFAPQLIEDVMAETEVADGSSDLNKTKVVSSVKTEILNALVESYDGTREESTDGKVPKAFQSISVFLTRRMPNPDVGVASIVKSILATDGAVNSEGWAYHEVANLNDAFLGAYDETVAAAHSADKGFINIHRSYNAAAEFYKNYQRFAKLLAEGDSRFSAKEKAEIQKEFVDHLVKYKIIPKRMNSDKATITLFESTLLASIKAGTANKEIILGTEVGIVKSDQFANENSVADVSGEDMQEVNTAEEVLVLAALSDSEQAKADRVAGLVHAIGNSTNESSYLFDLISDPNNQDMSLIDLLDTLQAAYSKKVNNPASGLSADAISESIREISNIIRNQIDENSTIGSIGLSTTVETTQSDEYRERKDNKRSVLTLIMQKLLEGTLTPALDQAQRESKVDKEGQRVYSAQIKAIVGDIKVFIANNSDINLAGVQALRSELIQHLHNNNYTEAIKTYLTQVLGTYSNYGNLKLINNSTLSTNLNTLYRALNTLSTESKAKDVSETYYSDGDVKYNPDPDRYTSDPGTVLSTTAVKGFFEGWLNSPSDSGQAPTSPKAIALLQQVLKTILIPGLESIDPLIQKILTDPTALKNSGLQDKQEVLLRAVASGNVLSSNTEMSLAEVAAHEYIHAIIKHIINDPKHGAIRLELTRLYNIARENTTADNFMPTVVIGDPKAAAEAAQRRYDHIFNNPDGHNLEEFMAIGLTNEPFNSHLATLANVYAGTLPGGINSDVKEDGTPKSFTDKLLDVLKRAFNAIHENVISRKGGNVSNQLNALAADIIALNRDNAIEIDRSTAISRTLEKANKAVTTFGKKFVADPLRKASDDDYRKRQLAEKNNAEPKLDKQGGKKIGLKSRLLEYAGAILDEGTEQGGVDATDHAIMSMTGGRDNRLYRLLAEFREFKAKDRPWRELLATVIATVDGARQRIVARTSKNLKDSFDQGYAHRQSAADRLALTDVVIGTDLSSLLDTGGLSSYTAEDILSFITDPLKRGTEIEKLTLAIKAELRANKMDHRESAVLEQIRSLTHEMLTDLPDTDNGMRNAYTIAKQYMLPSTERVALSDAALESLTANIDHLVTLQALAGTSADSLQRVGKIFKHENSRELPEGKLNGFLFTLGLSAKFKTDSLKDSFSGNRTLTRKNYSYDIPKNEVDIRFLPMTEENKELMKAEGYVLVKTIKASISDPHKYGELGIYKGYRGKSQFQKGIMAISDISHQGHNLFEQSMAAQTNTSIGLGISSHSATKSMNKLRNLAYANALRGARTGGVKLSPILNDKGDIVDYSYRMARETRKEIQGTAGYLDDVLPKMIGTNVDKKESPKLNRSVVKLLFDEYKQYGNGKSNERFVKISKDSTGVAKQMWDNLPDDTKLEAKKAFGENAIYIRDSLVNDIMGFRKASLLNNVFVNGTTFGKATPYIATVDRYWREGVKQLKMKIVAMPLVASANAASNSAQLTSENIPLKYQMQKGTEGAKLFKEFSSNSRALTTAEQARAAFVRIKGKSKLSLGEQKYLKVSASKIAHLKWAIGVSPIKDLLGPMATSILEDTTSDNSNSISKEWGTLIGDAAHKKLAKPIFKLGEVAVNVAKEAYLTPSSKLAKLMVNATQYGDFLARYTKYSWDTSHNNIAHDKALDSALATFIYYDTLQDPLLQAGNDYGFFMFSKFYLRIQHRIKNNFKHNPVSASAVILGQAALLSGVTESNISQSLLSFGGLTARTTPIPLIAGNQLDTLMEPTGLKAFMSVFSIGN